MTIRMPGGGRVESDRWLPERGNGLYDQAVEQPLSEGGSGRDLRGLLDQQNECSGRSSAKYCRGNHALREEQTWVLASILGLTYKDPRACFPLDPLSPFIKHKPGSGQASTNLNGEKMSGKSTNNSLLISFFKFMPIGKFPTIQRKITHVLKIRVDLMPTWSNFKLSYPNSE